MSRTLDRAGPEALLARPGVRAVLAALAMPGAETRLVGGCVRDALLGAPYADVDCATTLLPEAVAERARASGLKAVPTGIAHGTITLVTGEGPVEVTTLREDVDTDGRHAIVRFGTDFDRDAARRDFTINALSLGPDGRLHDPADGIPDLVAGRVRFIGDPAMRIREDALRILRFFRFHARFGEGPPDPAAMGACVAARADLDRLSRERVRAEFLKLLAAPGAVAVTGHLTASGLLHRITGGVGELGRLGRAVAAGRDPTIRLAALCVGARHDAERLAERLRLSRAEAARLASYAALLARLHGMSALESGAARALAADHPPAAILDVLAVLTGEPRPRMSDAARAGLEALKRDGSGPVFPLAGADLVARGVPPGPAVGRGLAAARQAWLDRGCPTDADAIAALIACALAAAG